jgi:hypothetical protein
LKSSGSAGKALKQPQQVAYQLDSWITMWVSGFLRTFQALGGDLLGVCWWPCSPCLFTAPATEHAESTARFCDEYDLEVNVPNYTVVGFGKRTYVD